MPDLAQIHATSPVLARQNSPNAVTAVAANAVIQAFRWNIQVKARREARPLPMACVAAWEEIVCDPASGSQLILLLGAFLLAYHACLRFGYLQRIRLSSLPTPSEGSAGPPKRREISCNLMVPQLPCMPTPMLVSFWKSATEPDSLLPILPDWGSRSRENFPFKGPMSYAQALPALRTSMTLTSTNAPQTATPAEAPSFTLHSLKVGLLSAAEQRRLPEDARRTAGHQKSSAELYGRDDTVDSLWVQSSIAHEVSQGWRPSRPIARGGQAPTLEPPFSTPLGPPPDSLAFAHLNPQLARFL